MPRDVLDHFVDPDEFYELFQAVDREMQEILLSVVDKLREELTLDDNVSAGLGYLTGALRNRQMGDQALLRNQVSKAANILGLKTPLSF